MAIKQGRYITADTTGKKEMAIRTTELDKVKDDPFIRKSEVQQTVNNSTLPVSSRAVKLAIDSIESPSLDGYATEDYVDQKLDSIDLSSYASTAYVDGKLKEVGARVDSVDEKATEALNNSSEALESANTALGNANTALSTAQGADDKAQNALDAAQSALDSIPTDYVKDLDFNALSTIVDNKRDLDNNAFSGLVTIKSDNDEQGAGVLLQESDGTVRGQVVATDQGLQLTQYPKDGGLQTFTFPSEDGEISLTHQLSYPPLTEFGVVGDGVVDDTEAFLRAKAYYDNINQPIRVPKGMHIVLSQPLVFDKNYTGIVFDGDFNPFSYQNYTDFSQSIEFRGIADGQIAIDCQGLGITLKRFGLFSKDRYGFALRIAGYSGDYSHIRILHFRGSVLLSPSAAHEPIFNRIEKIDCYSSDYGLISGYEPDLVTESEGVANENTFINCRFRGLKHGLWLHRKEHSASYGFVFINCIWQENPRLGDGYFDIWKFSGFVRGVTFINGRLESPRLDGREVPRVNTVDLDKSKSLINTIGTYIISSMEFTDRNDIYGLGDVWNTTANFKNVRTGSVNLEKIKSINDSIDININNSPVFDISLESRDLKITNKTPYATGINSKIVKSDEFRRGNVWSKVEEEIGYIYDGVSKIARFGEKDVEVFQENRKFPLSDFDLGTNNKPYKSITLSEQPVVVSDSSTKHDISDIDEKYFKVLDRLPLKQYRIKSSTKSQIHFGILAQDWISACESEGIDPHECGVLSGDSSNGYAVRYGDLMVLYNAYILWKIDTLKGG